MMRQTIVCNIVGLTANMINETTPNLKRFVEQGKLAQLTPTAPAVTCSVQSTFLTGLTPNQHGIVGNGWYFKTLNEVMFWRQSNRLVAGEKVWQCAKRQNPDFTCANLFWWYNMATDVDISITPRPIYTADGRKIPDIYTTPLDLRATLQTQLGPFPLFNFWGPMASIQSSAWIMDSSKIVLAQYAPTLTLIYIPHLDYNLQRIGPHAPALIEDIKQVDALFGQLQAQAEQSHARLMVVSEYAISAVSQPIHLNRIFRQQGWLVVRRELGHEVIDFHASKVFAVCDHQVAHIYLNAPEIEADVQDCLQAINGIDLILDHTSKARFHLDHTRSGDWVVLAKPDAWFTYYYWLDEACAPDFARTVDIHHKPGYDPVELFIDPKLKYPKASIAWRLLKKKLGQRTLMDLIPLDATLVKGSHGSLCPSNEKPIVITSEADLLTHDCIHATEVKALILSHLFTP